MLGLEATKKTVEVRPGRGAVNGTDATLQTPLQVFPLHVKEFKQSLIDYGTLPNVLEILLSVGMYTAGKLLPNLLEWQYGWSSPIPYQTVQNGDVVLDLELAYPVRSETIPGLHLVILCDLVPLVVLIGVSLFGPKLDTHSALCVYLVGYMYGLNTFLTKMIKMYTGRFRPNFYELCGFNEATLLCEARELEIRNSQRSFPSGHASVAFVSMTTLSLYLFGKVGIHRHSKQFLSCCNSSGATLSRVPLNMCPSMLTTKLLAMLAMSPMLLALFIAASRVHDFMHHPVDVVAGSLIGSAYAVFAHRLWYPPLCCCWAGYPLRTLYFMAAESATVVDGDETGENALNIRDQIC